ncbi:hypothetical protein ACHAXS_003009 [Conticribra weissflogii]
MTGVFGTKCVAMKMGVDMIRGLRYKLNNGCCHSWSNICAWGQHICY